MKKITLFLVFAAIAITAVNAQDVIVKRNGDEINAKVTEIGTDDVKYKKFDNQVGPTYTISKSELLMIRYENGDKDMFNDYEKRDDKVVKATSKNKSNIEYKKNAFGLDIGIGAAFIDGESGVGTTLGIRYLHNFSQYFGVDFMSYYPVFAIDGVLHQFMVGVRAYAPRFGKKMNKCFYGSFKIGGGFITDYDADFLDYGGVSIAPEIGIHLSNTFFMGLSYNVYIAPFDDIAFHSVALRIGFNFGK
ncbi:hypothetical protein FACS1894180_7260 [Bacteroidia bacterium]|nr:hypothetical protein FACS1894178_4620 [Bacteroidia bacterium]GHV45102.1 hypothetical protein FACS1894180_7260 [Bacteroidia bacterium]